MKLLRPLYYIPARRYHRAESKHGYGASWAESDWESRCADKLIEHMQKGDPRDVAAYCAFMWHHGWRTSLEVVAYAQAKS